MGEGVPPAPAPARVKLVVSVPGDEVEPGLVAAPVAVRYTEGGPRAVPEFIKNILLGFSQTYPSVLCSPRFSPYFSVIELHFLIFFSISSFFLTIFSTY